MDTELLKTGLYLIRGGGCNSLLRLSAAGCLLVDAKLPGTYRALMSQVRRINRLSDLPLRAVILTNHHDRNAGNLRQLLDAGVAVLAQSNALPRLPKSSDARAGAASSARRPSGTVFGFEHSHGFRMGGIEVRLHHFGRARTDADIVVLFPDLRVLAVGELYSADAPLPDFAGGGTLPGWAAALDQVMTLDFDLAVPSQGPPLDRAELAAFKSRLETLTSRALALVRAGVPRERFLERLATDDLGWTWRLDTEGLDRLYADLARGS